jgi:superfamily II DNA or RNA helicase
MPFKPVKPPAEAPANPEVLFRDLKSRKVHGLLTHQGEVINSYMANGVNAADVSIQLPTGSGKTAVGLLIGEWRRQKFGERVVYLCPTNQLVHQVAQQAAKFGLNVAEFTGAKSSYPPKSKTDYANADIVAVTSYSALFNSNPFFDDPHLIVLDDAHTSGDYVGKPWSVRIRRNASSAERRPR